MAAAHALGLPASAVVHVVQQQEPELPVWPENMAAVRLFSASLTQWRMGAVLPVGLDYPAVLAVARKLGLRCTRRDMQALQVMEGAALDLWAEQAKARAKQA